MMREPGAWFARACAWSLYRLGSWLTRLAHVVVILAISFATYRRWRCPVCAGRVFWQPNPVYRRLRPDRFPGPETVDGCLCCGATDLVGLESGRGEVGGRPGWVDPRARWTGSAARARGVASVTES